MRADMNHHHHRDFVSPHICVYLEDQGMNIETSYKWRVIAGEARLHSHIFDLDNIYRQEIANADFAQRTHYVSAFSIADMQLLLPDYMISKDGNMYTVTCDKLWGMPDAIANRLPDALAEMVLQAFRNKIINADKATKKLMNL